MSHHEPSKPLPTQPFELDSGLSLTPRVKLNLTIHRADKSVSPVDEWKLKRSLIDYFKASHSVSVPEEDIKIVKYRDLKKRKREDPVAGGSLFVVDLGFLSRKLGDDEVERKFAEWRKRVVGEMDRMEVNLEGVKFRLSVEMPKGEDFDAMRKEWEEMAAFGTRGYPRGERQQPDTIILRGMPSRWFAEPRVSSKPSMLVTHTILSAFGKIRNLDVGEDNGVGDDENEDGGDLISGLHCKIVVRFEDHKGFCNALKILCGRSLSKQGSRLRADYEVSWDRDGYFRNGRSRVEQSKRWTPTTGAGEYRSEASGRLSQVSRFGADDARRKRFKMSSSSGRSAIGRGRHTGGRMAHSMPPPMNDPLLYPGDETEVPETTSSLLNLSPSSGESSQGSSHSSRLLIRPHGNTFFPEAAVRKASQSFKSKFDEPWLNFSEVPNNVKDLWFAEFQKKCQWADEDDSEIRRIWKRKTAEAMRNSLTDIRREKVVGQWLGEGVREALKRRWQSDPEFLRVSETNRQNVRSSPLLPHRGGSISVIERSRRLENELRRPVPIPEVFSQMHYDGKNERWVHERAETTYDTFQRLVETRQTQGEEQLDEKAIFFEATGGKNKKGRSYGFGSEVAFYAQGSGVGTSSTQSTAAAETQLLELVKEMKELKDENSALRAQMRTIRQLLEKQIKKDGSPGDTSTPPISPSDNQDDEDNDM